MWAEQLYTKKKTELIKHNKMPNWHKRAVLQAPLFLRTPFNLPFTAPPTRRRSSWEVSSVGSCVLQCTYIMYTVLGGQFFNVGAK
jgi:hypothetical protein